MKQILILLAALSIVTAGYSAPRNINVINADNSEQSFALSSELKITFDDDEMIIKSDETDALFSLSGIKGFYYSSSTSENGACLDNVNVSLTSQSLTISGLGQDDAVYVWDNTGRCVSKSSGRGEFTLDLTTLAPGTYIVGYKGKSIKFAVRR